MLCRWHPFVTEGKSRMADHVPYTFGEITTQTAAWAESLRTVEDHRDQLASLLKSGFDRIVYTGCGSTYYLSMAGAALLRDLTRQAAEAFPASEFLLYPDVVYPANAGRTLLIVSSRSGRTTETLRAVEAFRERSLGTVLTITNYPDSPLVDLSDLVIGLPAGQEVGTAQTRSFAAMYVAVTAINTLLAGRMDLYGTMAGLLPAGDRLLEAYADRVQTFAQNTDLKQFYYLGSGPRYPLACEASLKMKEISLSFSEPFHFMEFRHGPMSMVGEQTAVVGLVSSASRSYEEPVLKEMVELGGQVLSLAEQDADFSLRSNLPEPVRGVLYLPLLQLLAYYRALALGRNPDKLQNVTYAIEIDLPPRA